MISQVRTDRAARHHPGQDRPALDEAAAARRAGLPARRHLPEGDVRRGSWSPNSHRLLRLQRPRALRDAHIDVGGRL